MPSIVFDRWDFGLDHRRNKAVADANRLVVLDNAYVTLGRSIKKRPCLTKVADLEPGTKGLIGAGSKLHTFFATGAISHLNPFFEAHQVSHPTIAQDCTRVSGFMFLGFLYVAVRYTDGSVKHHYLDGTAPTYIVDANCPNTEGIAKAASKIFAPGDEVVRFCATSDARDWTAANDAGFLPVGIQATGEATPSVCVQFRDKLAVQFVDSTQIWIVDPDPTNMALDENVAAVGSRFVFSPVSFSGDTYFLSEQGYRSISVSAINATLQDLDVGTPIDDLVRPNINDSANPLSIFYQTGSQIWSFWPNYAWVYTYSRLGKITAWSRYTFPFNIDATTTLAGRLYVRSGDAVYVVDPTVFSDDGVVPEVRIEPPYTDCRVPGTIKMFTGADAVSTSSFFLSFRFDPNKNEQYQTDEVEMVGDTSPDDPSDPDTGQTPIELGAVKIQPVIRHQKNEDFEIAQLTVYFERL